MNGDLFIDMTDRHLAEMTDLWVKAWTVAMPEIDFNARRQWLVSHLAQLRESGSRIRILVDRDGKIGGFVTIQPVSGGLDQLVVRPSQQGRGAGAALMEEAKRLSPLQIALEVNEANYRARSFYQKHGFTEVGRGINENSGLNTIKLAWRP